ncbi:MAG TPA: hypothetical protein VGX92_08135 [Pyrinomonadaceae bacterium]|jgi:hypothetical protein|nr:hypothetical protein [Pyrinomonadaceae bacterium]
MKSYKGKIGTIIALVFSVLLVDSCVPTRGDTKLEELRKISSEIPTPPSFNKVGSNYGEKEINAIITNYYKSPTNYEVVRDFYSAALTSKGWVLYEEEDIQDWFRNYGGKKLEFKKGEFYIAIQYEGANARDTSANYTISYIWRAKGYN